MVFDSEDNKITWSNNNYTVFGNDHDLSIIQKHAHVVVLASEYSMFLFEKQVNFHKETLQLPQFDLIHNGMVLDETAKYMNDVEHVKVTDVATIGRINAASNLIDDTTIAVYARIVSDDQLLKSQKLLTHDQIKDLINDNRITDGLSLAAYLHEKMKKEA